MRWATMDRAERALALRYNRHGGDHLWMFFIRPDEWWVVDGSQRGLFSAMRMQIEREAPAERRWAELMERTTPAPSS